MAPRFEAEELKAFKETIRSLAPLKQLVSADDVAEAALWFALGGPTITGQQLVIDGGTHLTTATPVKTD
jgi:enoyl-[acyl-carrier-protein] reductase (NADH)